MSVDDTLYDATVQKLKETCGQYTDKTIEWKDFFDVVTQASGALSPFGKRDIRELLDWAGEQLEMLQFTFSGKELFDATLETVAKIENEISNLESSHQ